MLSPTADTVRLYLHVLAASIWVGGQIALAGVVPVLRRDAPNATRAVARAFARLAWPAFAVLVATGLWSLVDIDVADTDTPYQITVFVKVSLSITAAVAVAIHSLATSKLSLVLGGAIGLLSSLGAMFLGILLNTGT